MKRFFKLIGILAFALISLEIFITIYNRYLDQQVEKTYNSALAAEYGNVQKNQGLQLQKMGISQGNFMLYGSSELGIEIYQNPGRFFPVKGSNFIIDLIGRGYVQDLQHQINLGALSGELKGKKIGLVVSMQWFTNKSGIRSDDFLMNFTPVQFYNYMDNDSISKKDRQYVAQRVYELIKGDKEFQAEALYAKLNSNESIQNRILYYLFKPYYFFEKQVLDTRDKMTAIKFMKKYDAIKRKPVKVKNVNWKAETKLAEQQGKQSETNNDFYISNNYYITYMKNKLNKIKNCDTKIDINSSLEYQDFDHLLKLCKQMDIKPYIIIMPVNGRFYDYSGISREEREKYYDTIEKMAKSYGFKALNLKDKDYEPYFMIDIMHLGWKGWLYIDEKIAEYNK